MLGTYGTKTVSDKRLNETLLSYKGFVKEEAASKPAEPGVLAGFRPAIQRLTRAFTSRAAAVESGRTDPTPSMVYSRCHGLRSSAGLVGFRHVMRDAACRRANCCSSRRLLRHVLVLEGRR